MSKGNHTLTQDCTYEIVRPKGESECFHVYIRNGRWVDAVHFTFSKETRREMVALLKTIARELES